MATDWNTLYNQCCDNRIDWVLYLNQNGLLGQYLSMISGNTSLEGLSTLDDIYASTECLNTVLNDFKSCCAIFGSGALSYFNSDANKMRIIGNHEQGLAHLVFITTFIHELSPNLPAITLDAYFNQERITSLFAEKSLEIKATLSVSKILIHSPILLKKVLQDSNLVNLFGDILNRYSSIVEETIKSFPNIFGKIENMTILGNNTKQGISLNSSDVFIILGCYDNKSSHNVKVYKSWDSNSLLTQYAPHSGFISNEKVMSLRGVYVEGIPVEGIEGGEFNVKVNKYYLI